MKRGAEIFGILAGMGMIGMDIPVRSQRPKPGTLDEYELIRQKKSKLSVSQRAYIVRYIDDMVDRGLLVRSEDGSVSEEIILRSGRH